MRFPTTGLRRAALASVLAVSAGALATPAIAKDKVVMGIPSFLTGAAAPAFGVPAKNGAEIVIEGINAGILPPPYDSKGLAGARIEALIYDESGGNTKQVAEFRNKVQKQGVEVFTGFVSSGTCQAITPVAEELQVLTVYGTCGTPRVFEELDTNPKYVFRTMSHATADNIAVAHYVKAKFPDVKAYTGINQNYAWGQDSWRDFDLSMQVLMPETEASDKLQWPKLFSGQYGAEISALLLDNAELVHSSFYGGDLEAFIFQGTARGIFQTKKVIFTVGGTAVYRLMDKMPQGVILGARGPYGIFATQDNPLNNWFRKAYQEKYGTSPTGPSYQYAQSILAVKYAYDQAQATAGGKFPTTDQVIKALEYAKIPSFSVTVDMSLGNGHQGVTDHVYGILKWDDAKGEPTLSDVVTFPASCVMPPAGENSVEWIKKGMPGAKC